MKKPTKYVPLTASVDMVMMDAFAQIALLECYTEELEKRINKLIKRAVHYQKMYLKESGFSEAEIRVHCPTEQELRRWIEDE